jgi:hypothetical protein
MNLSNGTIQPIQIIAVVFTVLTVVSSILRAVRQMDTQARGTSESSQFFEANDATSVDSATFVSVVLTSSVEHESV